MKKKIVLFSLVASLLATSVPVYAANSTSEAGTIQSQIITQVASSWVVTVPATINVGAEKNANFEVTVRGDVADDTSVSVIPDSVVSLTDGKNTVSANITQDKQQWLGSEVTVEGVSANGNVSINDELTAGSWSGQLNFTVNCTEDLGDLLAKVEMMQGIDLYVLGDSIMDGVVGSDVPLYGTAEAIDNLYGTQSYKNYAVSGAYLTTFNPNLPNLVQQATALKVRISGSNRYTDKSAIVFDGGGNDFIYMVREGSNAEIDGGDIGSAFYGVLHHTYNEMTNASGEMENNPVIFIIPYIPAYNDYFSALKNIALEAQTVYDRLIVLDCRDFITDADLCSDKIHMNKNGQTKLAHEIVNTLYEWYN